MKDLNVKGKTLKLSEDNIDKCLEQQVKKEFLQPNIKGISHRRFNYIKIKKFRFPVGPVARIRYSYVVARAQFPPGQGTTAKK